MFDAAHWQLKHLSLHRPNVPLNSVFYQAKHLSVSLSKIFAVLNIFDEQDQRRSEEKVCHKKVLSGSKSKVLVFKWPLSSSCKFASMKQTDIFSANVMQFYLQYPASHQ
jgi:hypothetical protein